MATVYKAVHLRFDELRALKVMKPELANNTSFVKRFVQEAKTTRRLHHPNAVRVDDIDESEDGLPFIVMEYVAGRNLRAVIESEAPLSVERVCTITKQAAAALAQAEALGIVHRDIKPDNIVLVEPAPRAELSDRIHLDGSLHSELKPQEQVKVLDFGIAKLREVHPGIVPDGPSTLTRAGMVMGTPAYMSPEQATAGPGVELDSRSDLYSLGIVAYQMLAADLPIKADSGVALLLAHVQDAPTPILNLRPELPPAIASLVMRCLQKDPDCRPANAVELIRLIEDWEARNRPCSRRQKTTGSPIAGAQPSRSTLAGKNKGARRFLANDQTSGWPRWWRNPLSISGSILLLFVVIVALRQAIRRPGNENVSVGAQLADQPRSAPGFSAVRDAANSIVPPPADGSRQNLQSVAKETAATRSSAEGNPKANLSIAALVSTPQDDRSLDHVELRPSEPLKPEQLPVPAVQTPPTPINNTSSKDPAPSAIPQNMPQADQNLDARQAFEQGRARLAARNYEEAAAMFGVSVRLRPEWEEPLVERARVNAKLGRFNEVIEDCTQALRLNPGDPVALNFRGYAELSLNRQQEAISDLDNAIRIKPDYIEAFQNRGNARWNLKDVQGARSDFDTAKLLQAAEAKR